MFYKMTLLSLTRGFRAWHKAYCQTSFSKLLVMRLWLETDLMIMLGQSRLRKQVARMNAIFGGSGKVYVYGSEFSCWHGGDHEFSCWRRTWCFFFFWYSNLCFCLVNQEKNIREKTTILRPPNILVNMKIEKTISRKTRKFLRNWRQKKKKFERGKGKKRGL